jgi:hypothetical protein
LKNSFLCGLEQRLVDVRTGIVEADLNGPELFLDPAEYALDLSFLTGIDAERVYVMSLSPQFAHKPLGLGRITPADANRIATPGKTPRDGRADGVARTHKYRYAAAHSVSPHKFLFDTLIVTAE